MSAGRWIWSGGWPSIMARARAAPNHPRPGLGLIYAEKHRTRRKRDGAGICLEAGPRNSGARAAVAIVTTLFWQTSALIGERMIFEQIATGGCQSYLLGCDETHAAILIDPNLQQIDHYLGLAARDGLRIRYVLDTHTHADHFSAAKELGRSPGRAGGDAPRCRPRPMPISGLATARSCASATCG